MPLFVLLVGDAIDLTFSSSPARFNRGVIVVSVRMMEIGERRVEISSLFSEGSRRKCERFTGAEKLVLMVNGCEVRSISLVI